MNCFNILLSCIVVFRRLQIIIIMHISFPLRLLLSAEARSGIFSGEENPLSDVSAGAGLGDGRQGPKAKTT